MTLMARKVPIALLFLLYHFRAQGQVKTDLASISMFLINFQLYGIL